MYPFKHNSFMKEFLINKSKAAIIILIVLFILLSVFAATLILQIQKLNSDLKTLNTDKQSLESRLQESTISGLKRQEAVKDLNFLESGDYLVYYTFSQSEVYKDPEVKVDTLNIYIYDQQSKTSYLLEQNIEVNNYNGIQSINIDNNTFLGSINISGNLKTKSLNDFRISSIYGARDIENYIIDKTGQNIYFVSLKRDFENIFDIDPKLSSEFYLFKDTIAKTESEKLFVNNQFYFETIGFDWENNIILVAKPFEFYNKPGDYDANARDELYIFNTTKKKLSKITDINRGGLLKEFSPNRKLAIRSFVEKWEYLPEKTIREENPNASKQ